MSPDQAARRVIVASYLYYRCDSPIVSDAAFDMACKIVADGWDFLDPIRRWQCESEDAILASGSHVLITQMGEGCARLRHREKFGREPTTQPIRDWLWSEEFKCHYAHIGG